jgi:uncharacterized protein (DUF362 family)
MRLNRRGFLIASTQALAGASVARADSGKARVGLVQSSHQRLAAPASPEDPLDYPRVRDMVWKAIEYGQPRAGSLQAKIRPGAWVVVKPNLSFLRPQGGYRSGDITDFRVTKAVLEYLARNSKARRITVAEGGSYRGVRDPATDNAVRQNGQRVDAATFDWGPEEFPGWSGSLGDTLRELSAQFPGKTFDYIDLAYDGVRDASGALRRVEVPRTARGVGGFGLRTDYFVTNTIRNCDFLIDVPVMKVHDQCGITVCFKNYVGTAPREAYAVPGRFWNVRLHDQHSVEDRIDPFLVDLAAFHPPDYNVVDGIRGLQYAVHNNRRPDQTLRSNLVLAGEDTVAVDAVAASIMGFNPWDMDFLHLAIQRDLGTMDFGKIDVVGDEPDRVRHRWGKPRPWWGRGNREWLVSRDAAAELATWARYTAPTDTLHFVKAAGEAPPETTCGAAVRVRAEGRRKAFLWVGVRGRVAALLNGEQVMQEENTTRYRVGQFQKEVELRSGENLLVFRVQAISGEPQLSALLVGPRNDGDTVEGIRWSA